MGHGIRFKIVPIYKIISLYGMILTILSGFTLVSLLKSYMYIKGSIPRDFEKVY